MSMVREGPLGTLLDHALRYGLGDLGADDVVVSYAPFTTDYVIEVASPTWDVSTRWAIPHRVVSSPRRVEEAVEQCVDFLREEIRQAMDPLEWYLRERGAWT